ALEAPDQFGDEVLGISGGTAIAAGQDLAIAGEGQKQRLAGRGDRFGQVALAALEQRGGIAKMMGNAGRKVHWTIIALRVLSPARHRKRLAPRRSWRLPPPPRRSGMP